MDPDGRRFAKAIRTSIDMLLDGQHTGRYRWEDLHKTEKTHAGTLIEINIQRVFNFSDGAKMDYSINGVDVDCKFSQSMNGWMIPPEAEGYLLLVVWASDREAKWCAGLVRAEAGCLNMKGKGNRDGKRSLNIFGRRQIRWLFKDAQLKENLLVNLPQDDLSAIFSSTKSGQARLNELFRRSLGRVVTRNVVATVAMQDDYMKRVRGNGGARTSLKKEGILILGDYARHVSIARQLHIAEPGPGEFVSIKVRPLRADDDQAPRVILDGQTWVVASPDELASVPAPALPSVKSQ